MKTVLFLHGLESKPGGTKPKYLETHGFKVLNPKLPKYSFEESVAIAQGVIDRDMPDVIVGSSRGGAVAMCVDPGDAKLVLLAPAWSHFMQTAGKKVDSTAMILHSERDVIVKYEDSQQLTESCKATLITVGECHRMRDADALEAMLDAVKWVTSEDR
jgi:hypothetical protein